jgi:ethanolamine utilization protein EutP (predicted NTPase)
MAFFTSLEALPRKMQNFSFLQKMKIDTPRGYGILRTTQDTLAPEPEGFDI